MASVGNYIFLRDDKIFLSKGIQTHCMLDWIPSSRMIIVWADGSSC